LCELIKQKLKTQITGLLLLLSFTVVLLQPVMPFVDYFLWQHNQKENTLIESINCGCNDSSTKIAKVENNGDAYLKALIKRVCDQKDKEKPAVPLAHIPVFVKELTTEFSHIYLCPEKNYNNKISTFIIQADITSYISDIFHPPTVS